MRKCLMPLLLLLLFACHKEQPEPLIEKNSSANARISCPPGYEYDDQFRRCVELPIPYSPLREFNTACRKLSGDPLFIARIQANTVITSRLAMAQMTLTTPQWNALQVQANALVNSQSEDEAAVQAVLAQYGFTPAELEEILRAITTKDAAIKVLYPSIEKEGLGRMYEQAHRYLLNSAYVVDYDRNPYTGVSGFMEIQDIRDPNPPTWWLYLPAVDIYGHSPITGWTQLSYHNWMTAVGSNQSQIPYRDYGNPLIPFQSGPPPTTADELKKQKLKACVDVYNKSVNTAQAARLGAVVGCIATAMSNKKANGALKYTGILGLVLCYLIVDWGYDTAIDLYKAQFNQCKLDAG